MDNKSYLNLLISGLFIIFLTTCAKIEREPKVETGVVSEITTNSVKAEGNIIDIGDGISTHGHCWSINSNPIITDSKTFLGRKTNTGSFTSNIQSLQPGTKYYLRAYAQSGDKVFYGNELSFTTTSVVPPSLTTTPVSAIISTTATSGGNITSDGGGPIAERGVCWATTANPTTADNKTSNGTGSGSFTSNITGLLPGTKYYLRAYATNSAGTAYGNELTFTTSAVVPTFTTTAVSAITQTTATSGGNVTSNGGAEVTARGVCWSTSPSPTIAGSHTSDGSGSGLFSSNITGLTPNTLYYVRAYATNSAGTAYGNQISFTTDPATITDADGNIYNVIRIGTQLWMRENLKTTKYKDGTNIPLVTDNTAWSNLTTPGYCWYDNDEVSYKEVYGALYNWYSVNTGKLCPTKWHTPFDADWHILFNFLGGGNVAGGKLKALGTVEEGNSLWYSPNTGATNESGFRALPGGGRVGNEQGYYGIFFTCGFQGYFWSSSETSASTALYIFLWNQSGSVESPSYDKGRGFSVRCLRDN